MFSFIDQLSNLSTFVIAGFCVLHILAFGMLSGWARRDLRQIASSLDDFTRGLKHRSLLGTSAHLSDQIDAFIADINEVLNDAKRKQDRKSLLDRMNILDEKRGYLSSMVFQTTYNMCRTMVEAYPLAGVLGTILAIGAAMQSKSGEVGAASVSLIVDRFGDAIWSTFAGLVAAIVLMFLNSLVEPKFQRLSENRGHVQEMVAHAKRELSLSAGDAS
ncbi:MAG: MotA/TolQ/ExbB proton channel family protein [Planctomycetota bacterium]|nr:MotA/TolQ/ExbB proton channel family protein [Planctomycetota bacterium]